MIQEDASASCENGGGDAGAAAQGSRQEPIFRLYCEPGFSVKPPLLRQAPGGRLAASHIHPNRRALPAQPRTWHSDCVPLGVKLLLPLGLVSAAPAGADELIRIRYNNPGLTVDLGVGLWAWPLPMDYDGDGDLDLVVSSGGVPYEGTYFFENDSPPHAATSMPIFRPGVRIGEYRTNAQISHIDGRAPIVMTPGQEHPQFLERAFGKPAALPLNAEDAHVADRKSVV